jgi:hypothetical protein
MIQHIEGGSNGEDIQRKQQFHCGDPHSYLSQPFQRYIIQPKNKSQQIILEDLMRRISNLLLPALLFLIILSACTSGASKPEQTVESYLNAIVEADENKITTLSCAEWEENAMLELDSFQGVEVSLVDMQCSQSGSDGDTALVACSGHFLTSYDGENMEIGLETREFELIQQSGEWLVCGYR